MTESKSGWDGKWLDVPADYGRAMQAISRLPGVDGAPMGSPWKRQAGGSHYQSLAIQPSDYITANGLSWYAGNVIKYASRAHLKGQARSDWEKVIHYAELALDELDTAREDPEVYYQGRRVK